MNDIVNKFLLDGDRFIPEMRLIRKYNKGIRYLLCVIVIFSIYSWFAPFKDKKGVTITNAFQSIIDNSK